VWLVYVHPAGVYPALVFFGPPPPTSFIDSAP
jgi:hypothetical protein